MARGCCRVRIGIEAKAEQAAKAAYKLIAPRAISPLSEPSEPPHRLVFIDQCLTIAMYRDSSPTAQNDAFGGRVSIEQTSPSGVAKELDS